MSDKLVCASIEEKWLFIVIRNDFRIEIKERKNKQPYRVTV